MSWSDPGLVHSSERCSAQLPDLFRIPRHIGHPVGGVVSKEEASQNDLLPCPFATTQRVRDGKREVVDTTDQGTTTAVGGGSKLARDRAAHRHGAQHGLGLSHAGRSSWSGLTAGGPIGRCGYGTVLFTPLTVRIVGNVTEFRLRISVLLTVSSKIRQKKPRNFSSIGDFFDTGPG